TVLEINPRATTSIVGLRAVLPPGRLAAAWLAAVHGKSERVLAQLASRVAKHRPVCFDSTGRVQRNVHTVVRPTVRQRSPAQSSVDPSAPPCPPNGIPFLPCHGSTPPHSSRFLACARRRRRQRQSRPLFGPSAGAAVRGVETPHRAGKSDRRACEH